VDRVFFAVASQWRLRAGASQSSANHDSSKEPANQGEDGGIANICLYQVL
jgi:hypothetical protein